MYTLGDLRILRILRHTVMTTSSVTLLATLFVQGHCQGSSVIPRVAYEDRIDRLDRLDRTGARDRRLRQCEAKVLHSSAHKPALARRTSLRFPAFPRSARSLSAAFPCFPAFLHFATFPLCGRSALQPVLGHSCTAPMYFSYSPGPCLLVDTLFSI